MDNLNSLLNQRLREIHNHGQPQLSSSPQFDPTASDDDFLEQILSSVPSSAAASFPWADDQPPPQMSGYLAPMPQTSKTRQQHQICNGASKSTMIQQQLLLSAASNGLRSSAGAGGGLVAIPQGDHNDVVDGASANPVNDASIKALFNNGFTGSLGQSPNQPNNYYHPQAQNLGAPVVATSPPAASGGVVAGQPRQKVRARRGQATDPHSIAERVRRERIAERMKDLQELVPNANKTDKASMLDEIIDYVKFLQLQVKVLSMSRLGGAGGAAAVTSSEDGNGDRTKMAASANNEGMTVAEKQVAKLMEENMGSAMQYLQGKGLCLMPISLSTAISATTSHSGNQRQG